jgi:hypothetical protein
LDAASLAGARDRLPRKSGVLRGIPHINGKLG